MNKDQNEFKVIFDGEVELISTEVLISNLLNTSQILQEVSKELKGPKIDISIRSFAPGSFEIAYAIAHATIISGILSALTKSNLEYLKTIISIAVDIHKIKKHLGGEKPAECVQEGHMFKIKNNYGDIIIVDGRALNNYKNSTSINESLNKTFRSVDQHENIKGVKLTDKQNNELFKVERKDFKKMHSRNELIMEDVKEKIVKNSKLVLHKVVFERGYKWAFIYEGNLISAYIKDEVFYKNIDNYKFGSGDFFDADLKIIQKYDEHYKAYMNIDYEVIKVNDIKEKEHQKELVFKYSDIEED